MRVKKKYEATLKELTDRLERARRSKSGETASFDAFVFSEVVSVLESAIEFKAEIPDTDRRRILSEGISTAARDSLTPDQLKVDLQKAEDAYIRKPKTKFVLASSVTIADTLPASRHVLPSGCVDLLAELPTKYVRSGIEGEAASLVFDPPARLTQVLSTVSARSATAAFEEAMANVDLLRALWNFSLTRSSIPLFMPVRERPLNVITPGPLHTLHRTDGAMVEGVFWYERYRIEPNWVWAPGAHWKKALSSELRIRARLRAIEYRKELEAALVRYVRALDEVDSSVAFTRLWGVLEFLTWTKGEYDRLISRVAFLSNDQDRGFVKLLLEHLRDVRNGLVHTDQSRSNVRNYLYQLKGITEGALRYHLRNRVRFPSIAKASEYLDTPTDREILRARLRDCRQALSIRRW